MKTFLWIIAICIVAILVVLNKHSTTEKIEKQTTEALTVALPSDFKYVVTETRENPGFQSINMFVEINQKLSKEQLKSLSDKIKSEQKFERVFIGYTLPQNSSGIMWANAEYNPNYKLDINGSTLAEEKKINNKSNEFEGDLIGKWYEEEYTSSTLVLFKKDGKTFLNTLKKKFGSDEIGSNKVEVKESKHPKGTKLSYKNTHGEYYVLSSDKKRFMFFNGENKCFTTALPVASNTFDTKNAERNKELEIKGNTAAKYTKKESSKEMGRKVSIIVQEFIKKDLYHPDEADFSDDYRVQDIGSNKYYIVLTTTTRNSFGQQVKISCKFKLQYNGKAWEDSRNWTVIEKEMLSI